MVFRVKGCKSILLSTYLNGIRCTQYVINPLRQFIKHLIKSYTNILLPTICFIGRFSCMNNL